MLNARRRMLFGNTQANMPSRFMDEVDSKYIESENNKPTLLDKVSNFCKEDKFKKEDVDFTVGDHISHPEFGVGVVVMVDKSIVTIAFPHPYGVKKMMKKHKSLTKL